MDLACLPFLLAGVAFGLLLILRTRIFTALSRTGASVFDRETEAGHFTYLISFTFVPAVGLLMSVAGFLSC